MGKRKAVSPHPPLSTSSGSGSVHSSMPIPQPRQAGYQIYVFKLLADLKRAQRSADARQTEIAALGKTWNCRGVPVWRAFDFAAILRVRAAQQDLLRQRAEIEKTFGDRGLFLKDCQKVHGIVTLIKGTGFRTPMGRHLFRLKLAGWAKEGAHNYLVKDDPRRPGQGLPALMYAKYEVDLGTMDGELRNAINALAKAKIRNSAIASLILQTIVTLDLPTTRKTTHGALLAVVRRTLAR